MIINLSPYEKDRIIPESFSRTQMGRDLLAQDLQLKRMMADLLNPDHPQGETFWAAVDARLRQEGIDASVNVDSINKVWIMPKTAEIFVNGTTAYVARSEMDVFLETDYLAVANHRSDRPTMESDQANTIALELMREMILPQLRAEVNTGKTFAALRQIYNAMLLATWYKYNVKNSVINAYFSESNKIAGIDTVNPQDKNGIYNQYLQAFQKSMDGIMKETYNPASQEIMARKYVTGGARLKLGDNPNQAMTPVGNAPNSKNPLSRLRIRVGNHAMATTNNENNRLSRRKFVFGSLSTLTFLGLGGFGYLLIRGPNHRYTPTVTQKKLFENTEKIKKAAYRLATPSNDTTPDLKTLRNLVTDYFSNLPTPLDRRSTLSTNHRITYDTIYEDFKPPTKEDFHRHMEDTSISGTTARQYSFAQPKAAELIKQCNYSGPLACWEPGISEEGIG